jgi:hypothetical protein
MVAFSRNIIQKGNGTDFPREGDFVITRYIGWLFDAHKEGNKGSEYVIDAANGRSDTHHGKGFIEGMIS